MRAIADTGFLVAAAREADRHHGWAMEAAARLSEAPLTCEAVLAEAAHLLQSSEHVLSDRANFTVYRRNGREVIPALFPPN